MSTESRRIRVLLADDHSIIREGLQVMLERSEEFEVVGQARNGVEAVKAASELSGITCFPMRRALSIAPRTWVHPSLPCSALYVSPRWI